jgi:HAD superfamily hydrolase (TIGR01509 family)
MRTRNTSWDLIIFDCDGVLVDSEPIVNRIFAAMLAEIGLPMTCEETIQQFLGCAQASVVSTIEQRLGQPLPPRFMADFATRMYAALRSELQPVPGIVSTLDRIAAPICVASSGDRAKIRTSLEVTGLLRRFEGRLFSATEVPRGKPFPDLFLWAAQRMGAPPHGCAVVEDSPIGVTAGVAAGMRVFGYARLSPPERLAAAGALVFSDMAALPDLLQMAAEAR